MKMVNTFITDPNLATAVANLNTQRLGKQRVEAYQILNLLVDARMIARVYSYEPCPCDIEDQIRLDMEREKWFKSVFAQYKQEDTRLVYRKFDNKYMRVAKDKIFSLNDKTRYRLVTGGFCGHPMVLMWVGYINGLRHYINLCIDEWVKRGYVNNMQTYDLPDQIEYPWWVKSPAVICSHICALLRKERKRNEPDWYWPLFADMAKTEWYSRGYLWLSHCSYSQRKTLWQGRELPAVEICDAITNSS